MAINHKYIMTHAMVKGDFSDDVHSGVAELEGDHGNVGLAPPKELTTTSTPLHDEKYKLVVLAEERTSLLGSMCSPKERASTI